MSHTPTEQGADLSPPVHTSFVPNLDARQRAMLAEMGVRVWAPKRVTKQVSAGHAPQAEVAAPSVKSGVPLAVVPREHAAPPPPPSPSPARTREALVVASPQAPVLTPPKPLPVAEGLDWAALEIAVKTCEACGLFQSRHQAVLGTGSRQAHWMVVGEAPDEHDDALGEPFVHQAGQLLNNMLAAVGISREGTPERSAYLTQALKCRAPASRSASAEEAAQCEPYLARQLALVQPRIILAMGRIAAQSMLQTRAPLGRLRGQVHLYRGVPLIATYDLGYLLRTPAAKREAWADLCLALETLRGA